MPTRKQLDNPKEATKEFDWSKVDALTDAEIIAAAKSDPDSELPSDEELAEFKLLRSRKRSSRSDAAE